MVRKGNERSASKIEKRFGADGYITVKSFIKGDGDLNGKGRMFAEITVAPHSGIGYHEHNGDSEIYCILSGKAEYSDNGNMVEVEAGDVTFCPSGEGHAIYNRSDEPVEMIALVLYS